VLVVGANPSSKIAKLQERRLEAHRYRTGSWVWRLAFSILPWVHDRQAEAPQTR